MCGAAKPSWAPGWRKVAAKTQVELPGRGKRRQSRAGRRVTLPWDARQTLCLSVNSLNKACGRHMRVPTKTGHRPPSASPFQTRGKPATRQLHFGHFGMVSRSDFDQSLNHAQRFWGSTSNTRHLVEPAEKIRWSGIVGWVRSHIPADGLPSGTAGCL